MLQTLDQMLDLTRPQLADTVKPLGAGVPQYILFASFTDMTRRAVTVCVNASTFRDAWRALSERLRQQVSHHNMPVRSLRIDWVDYIESLSFEQLEQDLASTKRNYFRYGIALDRHFRAAFLEAELNANAMLYCGVEVEHARINRKNFINYMKLRGAGTQLRLSGSDTVYKFSTSALFITSDNMTVISVGGSDLNAGRRQISELSASDVETLIGSASTFLTTQVKDDGRFIYGWHPCFDREIQAYNSLRHASTLFSMIDAWDVTRADDLKAAIDRAMNYLCTSLISRVSRDGQELAFLVDIGDEIKLGGNAVCLLALGKYAEVFDSQQHMQLADALAAGILFMQDPVSGRFDHVLNFPTLDVKEPFRIIYYDGEAVFGLMRLYARNKNPVLLAAVEKAFDYFIEKDHWKAHDHWLSYATNELTRYRSDPRYFEFGLKNFSGHLDFVLNRITTFPTLLELMMAAEEMLARLEAAPDNASLLRSVDTEKFYKALHYRAHYLLNGHFWPELAMFFADPQKIVGSFFIRHHSFRVRIDDVEHYLSGYCAYLRFLRKSDVLHTIKHRAIA